MKDPKFKFVIIKESEGGYSAYSTAPFEGVCTQGETFSELQANILEATEGNLEAQGKPIALTWDDVEVEFDIPSLLSAFEFLNPDHLAKRAGIEVGTFQAYIKGQEHLNPKQNHRIIEEIRNLGKELSSIGIS